jgi:hypothetical protein
MLRVPSLGNMTGLRKARNEYRKTRGGKERRKKNTLSIYEGDPERLTIDGLRLKMSYPS